MSEFTYTIKDELGLHARPAGQLAKLAKKFENTTVYVSFGGKKVKASQLMMLMGLAAKKGDTLKLSAEGDHAGEAVSEISAFMQQNL